MKKLKTEDLLNEAGVESLEDLYAMMVALVEQKKGTEAQAIFNMMGRNIRGHFLGKIEEKGCMDYFMSLL